MPENNPQIGELWYLRNGHTMPVAWGIPCRVHANRAGTVEVAIPPTGLHAMPLEQFLIAFEYRELFLNDHLNYFEPSYVTTPADPNGIVNPQTSYTPYIPLQVSRLIPDPVTGAYRVESDNFDGPRYTGTSSPFGITRQIANEIQRTEDIRAFQALNNAALEQKQAEPGIQRKTIWEWILESV